jgi:hypothetical protein
VIVDVDVFDVNDWMMNVNYQTMCLYQKNVNLMMMNDDDDVDVVDDYSVFFFLLMILMSIENIDPHYSHHPYCPLSIFFH